MNSFFDSNVLLYLLEENDPKCEVAERLLAVGGVISAQVLNEFTDVARRKHKLEFSDIAEVLDPIREKCVVTPVDLATHELGFKIAGQANLRIYDACIVAAAQLAGCDVLYTEDMNRGQRIGGVTLRNPFM
ncbi:MAG: PIN domain-containing protein [Aestuariivirga sp.]